MRHPAQKSTSETLDGAVIEEARRLGINVSQAAESGVAAAIRAKRARIWKEENAGAIADYNAFIEAGGIPLAQFRKLWSRPHLISMATQYDLHRPRAGSLVVILQSDLLDQLWTPVVAPLVPASSVDRVLESLNPSVTLGDKVYLVMPQLAATLSLAELGERVGSLAIMHDAIVRAMDALRSGS